ADGARIFVETGPGNVLTGLVSRILASRPHVAAALDGAPAGLSGLLSLLARLAVSGVDVNAEALYEGRDEAILDLNRTPPAAHSQSAWLVRGHDVRPLDGRRPPHAMLPVTSPVVTPGPGSRPAWGEETVVIEYLRNLREFAERQQEIVLNYLDRDRADAARRGASRARPLAVGENQAPLRVVEDDAPSSEPARIAGSRDLEATLLQLVADRTGYPVQMLDLDLDLEADLSIDSIKRIEILGGLAQTLGTVGQAGGAAVSDELVGAKTLRRILELLGDRGA